MTITMIRCLDEISPLELYIRTIDILCIVDKMYRLIKSMGGKFSGWMVGHYVLYGYYLRILYNALCL